MELLMRGGADYHRLYNCSFYNVSRIPIERRRNVALGTGEILLTGIELILYLPCLRSIWNRRVHSFYKFMFAMGVVDIVHLAIIGPVGGALSALGSVYCDHPTTLYTLGSVQTGAQIGQHLLDLLLALNRCAYFLCPELATWVFPEGADWTWAWTLIPISMQIAYTTFGTPSIFSALEGNWMWNPHFGYANEMHEQYASSVSLQFYTAENWLMFVALPLIYFAFFVAVLKQTCQYRSTVKTTPIFKQVATISVVQSSSAFLSIILKHSSDPGILGYLHIFLNTQTCGIAPVIYLLFSKKIQKDVKKMLKGLVLKIIQQKYPKQVKK